MGKVTMSSIFSKIGLDPKNSKFFYFVVALIFVIYIFSGIYMVGADEEAVLLTFGKFTKTTSPGLHWYFPRPIAKVIKVKVTKIYRLEIGFYSQQVEGANTAYVDVPQESLMFTGDENILDVQSIVQYKIKDIKKYVFNLKEPNKMIKDAAEAAIRQVVGYNTIENVLTVGKDKIQEDTKNILQTILDKYESGIMVLNIQLQDVQPPSPVMASFKDVASAKEDKIRAINEANGYVNDIIPTARGEAQKIINDSQAYKERRIKEAEGDVARFLSLYQKYQLGKEVTEVRLYLETLEKVMPNMEKTIVDKDIKNGVFNILGKEGEKK